MGESVGDGPVFPLPEPNGSPRAARFRQEFEAVQGEWHEVDSIETARAWIDMDSPEFPVTPFGRESTAAAVDALTSDGR